MFSSGDITLITPMSLAVPGINCIRPRAPLLDLAPGLKADTVQPKDLPKDGVQRFVAWRCAGATLPATSPDKAAAETIPLKD